MTTVPAIGQFGPSVFTVQSIKGVTVEATFLKDSTGANYIIDSNTGKPYVVPLDYDPAATAAYFTNKLNLAINQASSLDVTTYIFLELKSGFQQGGWGDLQRPLADKTDVVPDFIAAASFNLGIAAAAGGVPAEVAAFSGGAYNIKTNGVWKFFNNPFEYGNNPARRAD